MAQPVFRVQGQYGDLLVDGLGRSLNYLGKMTSASITQPYSIGSARFSGYTDFLFSSATHTPLVAFAKLQSGKSVQLLAQDMRGSDLFVRAYCGSGDDGAGFEVQSSVTIYVFGILSSASGLGLKIKNGSGLLTHVFTDTDGPPLYPRALYLDSGYTTTTPPTRTIPSISAPAVFTGNGQGSKTWTGSGSSYTVTLWNYGWVWDGGTGISMRASPGSRLILTSPGGAAAPESLSTVLIDTSLLP